MELRCKRCHAELPAEDVNIERLVAKCRYCNSVFPFSFAGEEPVATRDEARRLKRVELPKRMSLDTTHGELRLVRRWFHPKYFFFAFFCMFWDGFLLVWYAISFAEETPGGIDWVMRLFPILHVAVGVGLTYSTIAGFLNKTLLVVRANTLSIKHGPIPWPGNKTLDASRITQLYCQRKVTKNKNSTSLSYVVNALVDDKEVALVSGLEEEQQVLYIEQSVEDYLGIIDRSVSGELTRSA